MFKLLDKKGGEVTAEQQAVFNKISTNNADGYVDGFLNSLRIAKMSSNVISIDSGLLLIQGFRSINDTLTTYTVSVTPSEPIPFQLVATYSHFISDENDTLEITTRPTQELRREPLFAGQNAVYEVELAEFNMTADGIADFTVTLEKIVYNEQDLSELLDKVAKAEHDSATALEKVNELETQVIEKQGTAVYVGGEAQSRVNFTSDPQTQITANKNAISDIVSGAQTVGKATRDANGNVIEDTYTTKNELTYISNSEARIASAGWHTVAKCNILNGAAAFITVHKMYSEDTPNSINLSFAQTGYETPVLNCLGVAGTLITRARYVRPTNTNNEPGLIQIYYNSAGSNFWYCSVVSAQKGDVTAYLDPTATTSDTSVQPSVTIDTPGGCSISTSSNIYANGAPVLVGSAPTWVEGTSGSLTLPSSGWYYLQASTSSSFGNNFGNSGIVYVDITKINVWFPLPQNLDPDSSYSIVSSNGTLYARTGSDTSTWYIRYYKLA